MLKFEFLSLVIYFGRNVNTPKPITNCLLFVNRTLDWHFNAEKRNIASSSSLFFPSGLQFIVLNQSFLLRGVAFGCKNCRSQLQTEHSWSYFFKLVTSIDLPSKNQFILARRRFVFMSY